MVELKTAQEIELMRRAGQVVAGLLERLVSMVRPGLKTKTLDQAARAYLRDQQAQPAFLGYRGYPAAICVSVNEEVVHGIPGERIIEPGDLVSIDVGAMVSGFCGDAALTTLVEPASPLRRRLLETTRQALDAGISQAVAGQRVGDISHAVQQVVEQQGFGVVRDFVGHGIGRAMHEEPAIPNFGPAHVGPRLRAGMVIAIEPMVTQGDYQVEILEDGWTAVTKDRLSSAHFEHTVAITEHGAEILTRERDAERRSG